MNKVPINHLISTITQKLPPIIGNAATRNRYAWWLVQAITKKKELSLLTQQEIHWNDAMQATLDDWLDKLINQQMPLQYILGTVPFCDVEIIVKPPILIPRPETEEWVSNLIAQLKPFKNEKLDILDLCTGTGCIALALAQAFPKANVYATDINAQAIALAQENAAHNHLPNVTFLYSDLFEQISPAFTFDLILGNPPYIPESAWQTLEKSVKDWEDVHALVADEQGMALIKKIIAQAPHYIKPNNAMKAAAIPHLLIEIDYTQGQAIKTYMQQHHYNDITIKKDLEGNDRVACGRVDHVAVTANTR
jgi:release factor glutamine methyltransferase